jgi:hypothetical protein
MNASRTPSGSVLLTAMVSSGIVTAQFVAGKATRDALFLAHLDVTSLPAMVVATAAFSILLVWISSTTLRYIEPLRFVPLAFVVSAGLLFALWGLAYSAPVAAAQLVYLQISGFGPMLGSGFWLIATERFDPRTAKRRFGQIAGAGTLGGLLGGLLAERVATMADIETMLPILAILNLVCAWHIRRLATPIDFRGRFRAIELSPDLALSAPRSGLQVLARAPYLRNLAALVLLGTMAAALIDYVFKAQAVATLGSGEALLRFFAVFYAAVSLVTFVVQTACSRLALEKLGLAFTTGTPSIALFVAGIVGLFVPGLESSVAARGGEQVFRSSLFRAGYELFFTPIPPEEKRAAKSIIDVGFDRLGDALGGAVLRAALMLAPGLQSPTILAMAIVCSAAALVAASRLNRGYVHTLERSLLNRAVALELSDVEDMTTRTTMLRTQTHLSGQYRPPSPAAKTRIVDEQAPPQTGAAAVVGSLDSDLLQILALRSRDRDRVLRVLRADQPLSPALVPHVVPLLAWDPVANECMRALGEVVEQHVGQLIDALTDPKQEFAVRRRLARVFSVCRSQRAADGLLMALDDSRFEVRYQSARSLAAIVQKNPRLEVDKSRIFEIVRRETAVGRPVWESQRLLNRLEERDEDLFVDSFVKDRASRSLAHVFTLLSLALPPEPLQIAFRGLHSEDRALRGTALEYLESILPAMIRDGLWPFLEDRRQAPPSVRPREEILADLLKSHQSMQLNIEELKRRAGTAKPSSEDADAKNGSFEVPEMKQRNS